MRTEEEIKKIINEYESKQPKDTYEEVILHQIAVNVLKWVLGE